MTSDASILETIGALVGKEHELRTTQAEPHEDRAGLRDRLQQLETELDQCWDLLNQRRALRAVGASPDTARLRSAARVDGYGR